MNAPPAAKPVSGETRHLGAAADLHQTGSLRITAAGSSFVSVASTNRKPLASQIGRARWPAITRRDLTPETLALASARR